MGEVYLAQDLRLHRPVALKLLPVEFISDPDRRVRFEREARMAAALHHPHICTIYEVSEAGGRPFIAMEYVDGATLHDRIRVDLFSLKEAVEISLQIADALDEARTQHVVHRDLKSTNILLTPRGDVKILDFGLAKRVSEAAAHDATTEGGVTDAGMVVGTAAYMSPEQALGRPVDHRSDLFSFGVVLYELLTGRLPFSGRTQMELFNAILHETPPPIPRFNEDAPDPLVRVVSKLLEKDREQRYQSARDVRNDLQKIRDEGASASGLRAMRAARPRWLGWAEVGVVLVVMAAGALFWYVRGRSPLTRAGGIVVLPAQVFGSTDLQYLSDAVPATLSTQLAQVEGLETKAPPTSLQMQQIKGDVQQVADAYGVKMYVTASVLAQGDRLTLNLQLVDSPTRRVLWSHEYEGSSDHYLPMMREAADGVRQVLRPASSAVGMLAAQTTSSDAELALRQGEYYQNRYNNLHQPPDFDLALASLQRALQLDPKLGEAAADIAFTYVFKIESGASVPDTVPSVASWGQRAVTIDPRSSKGWAALAAAESFESRQDARKMLEYALKATLFGPNVAIAHNALAHTEIGNTLALEAAREAYRIDPLYLYGPLSVASLLDYQGRSHEALPLLDYILKLEPDMMYALNEKALVLAGLDRAREAADIVNRIATTTATRVPELFSVAVHYAVSVELPDAGAAGAALERFTSLVDDPHTPAEELCDFGFHVTPFLARHSQTALAIRLLTHCADEERAPPYDWLMLDPRLGSLKGDVRFAAVVAKARTRFVEAVREIDQARAQGESPGYLDGPLAALRVKLKM
jgi:TolB-like protein